MEVHGLSEELTRLRKQKGNDGGDNSAELERNKSLLVKARSAIGKLQVATLISDIYQCILNSSDLTKMMVIVG